MPLALRLSEVLGRAARNGTLAGPVASCCGAQANQALVGPGSLCASHDSLPTVEGVGAYLAPTPLPRRQQRRRCVPAGPVLTTFATNQDLNSRSMTTSMLWASSDRLGLLTSADKFSLCRDLAESYPLPLIAAFGGFH